MTPYADDLSACIAVLMAAEQMKETANDVYFVFTVQEEVGLRGATVAAYRLMPYMCIACDVCYTGGQPGKQTDDGGPNWAVARRSR